MRKKIRLYFTFMGVALRAKMMHCWGTGRGS